MIFARSVFEAMRSLQNVARDISYETKTKRSGQIGAKTDHNLSNDELLDVMLIVILLSCPTQLQAILSILGKYFEGLQMTSKLQFSYTNLSAVLRVISQDDINTVIEQAKIRAKKAIETDPLNILVE